MAYTTAGLQGHLDYSDLSTLYTTSARTTLIANTTGAVVGGVTNKAPGATAHASLNGPVLGNMGSPRALLLSGASQSIVALSGITAAFAATDYFVGTIYRPFQPAVGDGAGVTRYIFRMTGASGDRGITLEIESSVLTLRARSNTTTTSVHTLGNVIAGQVNHLGLRFKANGTVDILLNNAVQATVTRVAFTGAITFDTLRLDDGASGSTGTNWFKGNDGEVLIYNTALSDADFAANFAEMKAKWPTVAVDPTDVTLTNLQDFFGDASGPLALAGSYTGTGTPATLWAKYQDTANNNADVAAYVNTGAVFTGNNFTGGVLPKPAADGVYRLRLSVRSSASAVLSDTLVAGQPTIERGVIIGATGSSTARRWYEDGGTAALPYLSVYTTVDHSLRRTAIGAGCRGFASGFHDGVGGRPGRACPIRMVVAGDGGVSIDSYSSKSQSSYIDALAAMVTNGGKLDLLLIGCRDVNDDSTASPSREGIIRDKQLLVQGNFRGDLGQPTLPIQWIGTVRRPGSASTPELEAVWTHTRGRHITAELDSANVNVKLGSTGAGAELQSDDTHPSPAEMFNSGRQNAHRALGGPRGSRFVSAAVVGSAMRFTAVHPHGTDFDQTTNIRGFDVFDKAGALVSTGLASRVDATHIDQPFTDNGNGPFHGYFLGGLNPGGQSYAWDGCLRDNSTDVCNGRGIPVEPTVSAIGQMLYGSQIITLTN